jgi:ferredoxin--NADP+ reductase
MTQKFNITHKQVIALDIKRIDIHAPQIVSQVSPGQFVSLTVKEGLHSIPLSIIDFDERKGTISFIVHEVGAATKALGALSIGQSVVSVVGPLGKPAFVDKFGIVVCIATGIGAAQILPICRALKKKGNKVIGIVGAKSKKVLMLEAQMRVVCDEIFITTNDGSYEKKGLATEILMDLLERYKVNCVYAIGSVDMMEAACQMARSKQIPSYVTVSTFMTNGLGICGSCRIKVGDDFQLACLDGPQFDGQRIDFSDLHTRMNALKETGWDSQNPQVKAPKIDLPIFVKSLWGTPRK